MAEMTPEEYADWVLSQQNLAANEYGRPWVNDGTDDFKELGYTVSGLKDIGSIAGIQWSDFYNIPEAPEMPTDTPYQSDYAMAIGGPNSVVARIAEGIRNGLTPQQSLLNVQEATPDAVSGLMPDDKTAMYQQAIKYNEEALRQNREQADYDAQMQQYNDWFEPGNMWDEAGYTDVDSFVDRIRPGGLPEGVSKVSSSIPARRNGDANGIFDRIGAPETTDRWFTPPQKRQDRGTEGYAAKGRNASKAVEASALDRMGQVARQKMQSAATPSQDELAKRARLAAAYSLITGSPAPR